LDQEAAVLEREGIAISLHNCREYLLFFEVIFITSVHKAIFLSGMAMEIAI
jgi:hypothetical protein